MINKSINIISKKLLEFKKLKKDIKRLYTYIELYKWHKFYSVQ